MLTVIVQAEKGERTMTHCEKCIHYEMCKAEMDVAPDDTFTFFPYNEDCPHFKNKSDYAEVKHGEWIERRGQSYLVHPMKFDVSGEPILQDYISYVCSCCGRTESNKEPYCHCGAKMDGGNAND